MLCTFPLLLLLSRGTWPEIYFCCSFSNSGALLRDSAVSQPQPTLVLLSLLCLEVQSFSYMRASMCVSDGLWWFWMVSSEHPCVYSSTKVSKAVAALCFSCFCSPSTNHPLLSVPPSFSHLCAYLSVHHDVNIHHVQTPLTATRVHSHAYRPPRVPAWHQTGN